MATGIHWSVSLWRDSDDVLHCQILSSDKAEWWLIPATRCRWGRCFLADQLWVMTHIREEEDQRLVNMYGKWWHVGDCLHHVLYTFTFTLVRWWGESINFRLWSGPGYRFQMAIPLPSALRNGNFRNLAGVFLSPIRSPAAFHETWRNDWCSNGMNPRHCGSYPPDTRVQMYRVSGNTGNLLEFNCCSWKFLYNRSLINNWLEWHPVIMFSCSPVIGNWR